MSKKTVQLNSVKAEILTCKICLKEKQGLLVPGEGSANSKIVFIGEAPGKEEIKTGRPFVGRAGKLLRELIASIGLKPEDVFITSAVKYLPKNYTTPKEKDISHGKIHLEKQLEVIKPKIVVVLGNTSAISLFQQKVSISEKHGTTLTETGRTYFLSYHPAAPLYSPKLRETIFKDFKKLQKLILKQ